MSRHGWLLAVCVSELGTLMVFSSFPALLPVLQTEWGLSSTQAGLIVGFYRVGHIGAVAILSTLTDSVPPRRIYLASALWTSATAAASAPSPSAPRSRSWPRSGPARSGDRARWWVRGPWASGSSRAAPQVSGTTMA